jgi:hypothetical protein
VPNADRPWRRAEIGGDDAMRASHAMDALADEHSSEMLEQLLIALAKQNISAPMRLVAYVDDPRVIPALLAAVRSVPLEHLADFAQALGLVGGPGARDALRARMQGALADPGTFEADPFFNFRAGAATTCAEHLLDLDADDQEAADALVRLVEHVCPKNRRSTAWRMAELVKRRPDVRTAPMRVLRAALERLIDTSDDEVFCVVAPAVWRDRRVPERVSRLLESPSAEKQTSAVSALVKMEQGGWPLLNKWGSRSRDPIFVLTTLGPNLQLLSESRRAELARRGLADASPSIRHDAAAVLSTLEPVVAAKLARAALKDEPDPIIREKLMAVGQPARRSKTRIRAAKKPVRKRRAIKSRAQ